MNLRYLVIGALVLVLAIVIIGFRPFEATVSEEPGNPPPHAVNQ
jgi:hypothetical protein